MDNIFGERLKSARVMARLSLQELADKIQNHVTKQALSRYELGVMAPQGDVVVELSRALGVRPEYFYTPSTVSLGSISFRKRSGLPKKEEEAVIEQAKDFAERYLAVESMLNAQVMLVNPLEDLVIKTKKDAEVASLRLRDFWELGTSPVTNVLELLESKGIKIFISNLTSGFDGISSSINGALPLIVINKGSTERMRFTAIHEAAHTLLKFDEQIANDEDLVEIYCHYFASCFLLPTAKFTESLGASKRNYIVIDELIRIKENFGISLRAQLHRAKELSMISEVYYTKWMVYLTKKYGAKSEPGAYPGIEAPRRFEHLVMMAIAEGAITISKAAALSGISVERLNNELSALK